MAGEAWTNVEDLVFTNPLGGFVHPQAFSEAFERHAEAAGLPKIPLHGLRHTHATLALQAGIHPKVVSDRLGHYSAAFTLDTYSEAIPALQESAAETVAALVRGS
jgi:integrase